MTPDLTLTTWLQSNLAHLEALVFDIDGVFLNRGQTYPGTHQLLDLLEGRGVPYTFLTNDGDHSPEEKAEHLGRAGLTVDPERIVSCSHGLHDLAPKLDLVDKLVFIMGNLGRPCYAGAAGLRVTRTLHSLDDCQAVVVGEYDYDWETVINGVVNFFIAHPDRLLIVPNPDEYFPKGRGRVQIGAGGVARFMLQVLKTYGLEVKHLYLGKPYPPIFQYTHRKLETTLGRELPKERVLMVGDFLESDIKGANQFGYRSALVLTGLTNRKMLAASPIQPELVFSSI